MQQAAALQGDRGRSVRPSVKDTRTCVANCRHGDAAELSEKQNASHSHRASSAHCIVWGPPCPCQLQALPRTRPPSRCTKSRRPWLASRNLHVAGGGCADTSRLYDAANAYRTAHQAPPMEWDEQLAEAAQSYARQLARRGCTLGHSGGALGGEYGENLYRWAARAGVGTELAGLHDTVQGCWHCPPRMRALPPAAHA